MGLSLRLEGVYWTRVDSVANQDGALRNAAGEAFYNTAAATLADLRAISSGQRLRDSFIAYLDGFSPNVQEILSKFKFREQIQTLVEADILGHLISDFLNPEVNLSNQDILDEDGRVRLPRLDNHGMGTVFEELIRRFNEDNNEEAGEHFTPRDVVTDLRDTEQVPLTEAGGIEAFFQREVLPHASDAWIDMTATKIGYEVSFARYFYKPVPLRTLTQIREDILKLEEQTEGLLNKIIGGV